LTRFLASDKLKSLEIFSIEFDNWSIKVGLKKKAEGIEESGDMSTAISFSTLSPFFEV
jgi:hypothetical protein